jgi:hypothetical protein
MAAVCLAACASTSYIPVRYQLAPTSKALQGQEVYLSVTDARTDTRIFDATAQKEFEGFTGNFALILAHGDEKGLRDGTYDLRTLFHEALRHRLQSTGVKVLDQAQAGKPTMQVDLREFLLSLQKSKWVATVSYKVSLSGDPNTVVTDTVSGSAERVKVMGSGAAEKALGEIFSDSLNRLDVISLFTKAGLYSN